jgi:galactokinase
VSAAPAFRDVFGIAAEASADAPGRVNLLGEHTDYNDGFVLPTAIALRTRVDLARSRDDVFRLHSTLEDDAGQVRSYRAGERSPEGYPRYVDGCVRALAERGVRVPAQSVLIRSDVPMGSGLSSSAALEVALLRALRELLGFALDDVELALTAQRAENHYVGVRCGIMDQMASSLADERHMIFIDTRTLERRLLPFPPGAAIVALDSGIPRALADSGYNERRAECAAAARALGVRALRDVTDVGATARLRPPLDRRARHVVSENARVLEAARGAAAAEFGRLMNASHASLRDDYEVSVPPLDALVALLQAHDRVFGARLTGAGFGGACVALVRDGSADDVKRDVLKAYAAQGHRGAALV